MPKFTWKSWSRPFVCLAPMDGWTDSAFRQIVKEIEPRTIVFTEFVSVDGLTHRNRGKSLLEKAISHSKTEKPLVVQLFGKNPEKFALAAAMLEKMGADAIDINFGCPARKVVNHDNGAALLKNPALAAEIVRATKAATSLDVSVKTRLGWDNSAQIFDFGAMLLAAGADALTFHGRTAKQGFTGVADYTNIFAFKEKHPETIVIGNGDIVSAGRAQDVLLKLDGVMIGREAVRNPWIFREIFVADFQPPSLAEKITVLLRHAQLAEAAKGKYGIIAMRKFFAAACRGFVGASDVRAKLMTVEDFATAEAIFSEIAKEGVFCEN